MKRDVRNTEVEGNWRGKSITTEENGGRQFRRQQRSCSQPLTPEKGMYEEEEAEDGILRHQESSRIINGLLGCGRFAYFFRASFLSGSVFAVLAGFSKGRGVNVKKRHFQRGIKRWTGH